MKVPAFYAHTLEGEPPTKWQGLQEHLVDVAKLAASFAEAFQSELWGYCAGLRHDLGKYQAEFQEKLLGARVPVEQSSSGAALSSRKRGVGLGLRVRETATFSAVAIS